MKGTLIVPFLFSHLDVAVVMGWQLAAPSGGAPQGYLSPSAPAITPPPMARELFKRASFRETCGYVDGIEFSSITCETSFTCEYNTLVSAFGRRGVVQCCNDQSGCGYYNACVDSSNRGQCDADCGLNTDILKCDRSASPYCAFHYFPSSSVYNYFCASTKATKLLYVYPTTGRPTIESTVTALPIYSSPSSTSTTSRTSSSSSTSTSPAPTSPFVTPTPSPSSGGGSNAGAIAGGVVGGLAAIGLILGAVLLFLARKRRARNASAPNTGVPPHNGQVQYQGPNMSNPNTLSMSSQQMYNPQHQPLGSTSPPHHLSNPQMQTSPLLHGDYMHPQHSGQMPQPQGQTYLTSDGTGYTGQSRGSTDVTGSTVGYRGSDVPTGADGFKPATSGVVESGGSEVPKKIEPQNPNRHEMA